MDPWLGIVSKIDSRFCFFSPFFYVFGAFLGDVEWLKSKRFGRKFSFFLTFFRLLYFSKDHQDRLTANGRGTTMPFLGLRSVLFAPALPSSILVSDLQR